MMNTKQLLCACALLWCGAATAQNPYIAVQGAVQSEAGIVVSQPRTVLGVDVTVQCEKVVCGPYARYAQKYLGVMAPLTDKTTWSVVGASVALLDERAALEAAAIEPSRSETMRYAVSDDGFARIQPDKTDMNVLALEDAARNAANAVFALRRHRTELITGEAGENVFGEGLQAALAEIDRMEQRYLELFLGKRVVTTETQRRVVYPASDKRQYIVARFSESAGLLPESDLSGDMVLLRIEPSGDIPAGIEADPKVREVVACRVADPSTCTVICGSREYVRAVLPIFEFGKTVNVAFIRSR